MKTMTYLEVKEQNGMWLSGNYDTDDVVYYIVDDEIVQIKVDKEFLREKIFELEKVIYNLVK